MNIYNVRDYLATGAGDVDDTEAIQDAIDAAALEGGGIVYVPNGTYRVQRNLSAPLAGCIYLPTNITLLGESRQGAIIKLADDQIGFTRIITVDTADDVRISTLTLDGNKAGQSTPEEHMAGVFAGNCKRLVIDNVTAKNCVGDGFDIWQFCHDVLLENCLAFENDRSGIAVNGGGQERLTLRKSQFVGNLAQQVDTEPPEDGIVDMTIDNCFMSHGGRSTDFALTLSGVSYLEQSRGFTVTNNVIDGPVYAVWIKDSLIADNRIYTRTADTISGPLTISRKCEDVVVRDNYIECNTPASSSIVTAIAIEGTEATDKPRNVRFLDNDIVVNTDVNGFYCARPVSVEISGNTMQATSTHTMPAISAWATETSSGAPQVERLVFRNNHTIDFQSGVIVGCVGSGSTIKDLVVTDNRIEKKVNSSALVGLNLDGGGAAEQAEVHGNSFPGIAVPWNGYPACPILVGGNRGQRGTYEGAGAPAFAELVGATYINRNGGAGTTLYVKESSSTWTAK
jgi:polygalacturonase